MDEGAVLSGKGGEGKVDLELFGKSPAGRLVRVGSGEAAYQAFVPNPLPPALEPCVGPHLLDIWTFGHSVRWSFCC